MEASLSLHRVRSHRGLWLLLPLHLASWCLPPPTAMPGLSSLVGLQQPLPLGLWVPLCLQTWGCPANSWTLLCLHACPPLALGARLGLFPAQNSKPSMGSGPHTQAIKAPKKERSSLGQPARGSRRALSLLLPREIESQSHGPSPPPQPGDFLLRRRRKRHRRRRKAQLPEAYSWDALVERTRLQGLWVGCRLEWGPMGLHPQLHPLPHTLSALR